ncbi:hypothetical protein L227DRAFT_617994 [Lentinus tigrinus ALCF2SS1-6]|uniref:Uncharacterized protein n=1 Tax=Lentinus tigrinus ALCF2SS1-6 TaxID=1328759 RepID=A0A5C2RKV6_9APHY|nr:hypothetical protein L227DRAFT_617994 [Lentinus tigrinus ALCF2SS1-6]
MPAPTNAQGQAPITNNDVSVAALIESVRGQRASLEQAVEQRARAIKQFKKDIEEAKARWNRYKPRLDAMKSGR